MFASVGIWIGWCGVLWCWRSLRRDRRFRTGLELLSTVIFWDMFQRLCLLRFALH
jgi:hypothetical protein